MKKSTEQLKKEFKERVANLKEKGFDAKQIIAAGGESVYGYYKNGERESGGFGSIVEVVKYIEQNQLK